MISCYSVLRAVDAPIADGGCCRRLGRMSRAESLLNKRANTRGPLRPNKQSEAEAEQFIKAVRKSAEQESIAARHAYSQAIKGEVWIRVHRSIVRRETARKG